jgi:endonuclease/exonuclease/phosphatase family metal-dependent hydrolase
MMKTISVMTLNIWNDQEPWPQRAHLIREEIRNLEPDLIGFQEVLRGEGVDLLDDILAGTSYHRDFVETMESWPHPGVVFGNAIASRWSIISRSELILPNVEGNETRAALYCAIESPIGPVCFGSTHLNWKVDQGAIRERQVVALVDQLRSVCDSIEFPPILVGDFNAVPESAEIRYLKGLQSIDGKSVYMRDAWAHAGDGSSGLTWSRRNPYVVQWLDPDRRIDYIFVGLPQQDGLGEILSCKIVCASEHKGVWPSDHFGVYAELQAERNRT